MTVVKFNAMSRYNQRMSTARKIQFSLLIISVAALAAASGFWLAFKYQGADTAIPNQALLRDGPLLALPEAKELSDFTLYDHTGGVFSKASLQGDWRLVFFGFASCPHICPDTLFRLKTVVDQLAEKLPTDELPTILFISVDPERDTPEVLSEYRERFDGDIEAVSGKDDQLRALAMDFGAHYVIPEHEPGEWYNVDHSISVHVLDPEGDWVGLMSAPHDPEAMAGALERFIDDY